MTKRATRPVPRPADRHPRPRRAGVVAIRLVATGDQIRLPRELDRLTLGSHPGNDVVLDDPYVSARHCVLIRRGGRWFVKDEESTNGTLLDGKPVVEAQLEAGGALQLGKTAIAVMGPDETGEVARKRLIGSHPLFKAALDLARRAARSDVNVLLLGESGTGKELFARLIHESSPRFAAPFLPVNCGAIPRDLIESELFGHQRGAFTGAAQAKKGVFELAGGGTLFLDEIGELPLAQQPRLLRVLETRRVRPIGAEAEVPVRCRIVSATLRDLARRVQGGTFRDDLYHRVAGVEIVLPALRERPSDIPALVEAFLGEVAVEHGPRTLTEQTLQILCAYSWPGNVRELRNAVFRAALLSDDELRTEHLLPHRRPPAPAPALDHPPPPEPKTADEVIRRLMQDALDRHGTYRRAAAAIGMPPSTFHERARRFGLKRK